MSAKVKLYIYQGTEHEVNPKDWKHVRIASNVEEIIDAAFRGRFKGEPVPHYSAPEYENNEVLESVDFSQANKLVMIGSDPFYSCITLKEFKAPESLIVIKEQAFEGCSNLTDLDFSKAKNLTTIKRYAFQECVSLTKLIASLNLGAFQGRTGLTIVKFNKQLLRIDEGAGRPYCQVCASLGQTRLAAGHATLD